MSKTIERKREEKIWFNQQQRMRLKEQLDLVAQSFSLVNENLTVEKVPESSKTRASDIEKQINEQRDLMRDESQERSNNQEYNVHSELIYHNLFSSLERIGDHLFNISNVLVGGHID